MKIPCENTVRLNKITKSHAQYIYIIIVVLCRYNDFINNMPLQDIPEVFGLHSNADISYQINTAKSILDQILAVQPKESGTTSKGETREAVVAKIAEDMLRKLPR